MIGADYMTRNDGGHLFGRGLRGLQREHLFVRLLQLRVQRDNRHAALVHLRGGDGKMQSINRRQNASVAESAFHMLRDAWLDYRYYTRTIFVLKTCRYEW